MSRQRFDLRGFGNSMVAPRWERPSRIEAIMKSQELVRDLSESSVPLLKQNEGMLLLGPVNKPPIELVLAVGLS